MRNKIALYHYKGKDRSKIYITSNVIVEFGYIHYYTLIKRSSYRPTGSGHPPSYAVDKALHCL